VVDGIPPFDEEIGDEEYAEEIGDEEYDGDQLAWWTETKEDIMTGRGSCVKVAGQAVVVRLLR
jgi:hypothetical protein